VVTGLADRERAVCRVAYLGHDRSRNSRSIDPQNAKCCRPLNGNGPSLRRRAGAANRSRFSSGRWGQLEAGGSESTLRQRVRSYCALREKKAPDRHCVSLSDNFGLSSKRSSVLSTSVRLNNASPISPRINRTAPVTISQCGYAKNKYRAFVIFASFRCKSTSGSGCGGHYRRGTTTLLTSSCSRVSGPNSPRYRLRLLQWCVTIQRAPKRPQTDWGRQPMGRFSPGLEAWGIGRKLGFDASPSPWFQPLQHFPEGRGIPDRRDTGALMNGSGSPSLALMPFHGFVDLRAVAPRFRR
jgi:hypothetical protein